MDTAPSAPLNLRDALVRAASRGWQVARASLLPAFLIQALMFLLVLGYYCHWPIAGILLVLRDWQRTGGYLFSFLASGLTGGVLSEIFLVYCIQRGIWRPQNIKDAFFKLVLMGFGGLSAKMFYTLQAAGFGNTASWKTVATKVFVDQFIFNPLFAAPIPCFVNHWLANGLSRQTFVETFRPVFYIEKILPLLLTTWCFWIPMTTLIYSLPELIQFPLFLCAITTWGLVFSSLVKRPEVQGTGMQVSTTN